MVHMVPPKQIKYTISLTQDQLDDIMYNYAMNDDLINPIGIVDYVRKSYHAEYYPFRKELEFHDEKYYNWFILKYN